MYLCVDCEALFEDPKEYIERHGLSSPPYETWTGCPKCGGGYVETFRCDLCDEWVAGDYAKLKNGMIACNNCFEVDFV